MVIGDNNLSWYHRQECRYYNRHCHDDSGEHTGSNWRFANCIKSGQPYIKSVQCIRINCS